MAVDVEDAGVPLDQLTNAGDPRAAGVAAAAALRLRHLPARQRRELRGIEARREALLEDRRAVELRYYPAPWEDRYSDRKGADGIVVTQDVAGEVAKRISINLRPALLLYALIREFAPQRALEMGTGLGISGAYQAFGLRHGGSGRMLALEGAPDLAAIAAETYAELGLDMVDVVVGPFTETLDEAAREGVDYAYIDGHHDGRATVEYFEQLIPHAQRSLLVFDDVRWSDSMRDAWRQIANDERVTFAVNAGRLGLAFTGAPRRELRVPWKRRRARPSDLVARAG